ncbi:MAG: hypothetical protein JWM11_1390, partial [Planctomycetaceae bacterium]|nr:hypothetical protein [Planctomycetaceae bacterium]
HASTAKGSIREGCFNYLTSLDDWEKPRNVIKFAEFSTSLENQADSLDKRQ